MVCRLVTAKLTDMKHFVFPTVADANNFANELKRAGLVREERHHAYSRGTTDTFTGRRAGTAYTPAHYERGVYQEESDVAEEAAKGAGAGAVVGAGAALLGAAATAGATLATVATGGLAAPLIGLTLLGAGTGAAVGAAGEAMREADDTYDVGETHYGTLSETYNAGGRAVAVDDSVDSAAVMATAERFGGRLVG